MSALTEVKEQITVVKSVGDFTNALQQIATLRMTKARRQVTQSKPFVEAASLVLGELLALKKELEDSDLGPEKKMLSGRPLLGRRAVVVVTSNQGLVGSYNTEILEVAREVQAAQSDAEFFIIGKKGQKYMERVHWKARVFPYEVGDTFTLSDLTRLIGLFDYYDQVTIIYSQFVNTATHKVVTLQVTDPTVHELDLPKKVYGRYIYEPDLFALIDGVTAKLRASLFQQQVQDARLSQFSAQMIGMKAASDNANELLGDLRLEYNKQRRKYIDKKINEVFAGSALW
jgi:F-type H+-transporting ATPase subunit gamma